MPQNVSLTLIKNDLATNQTLTELDIARREWLIDLEADDYSVLTIQHYRWHNGQMLDWLAAHNCTRPVQLTGRVLRLWLISLKQERGWAASTRKQAVSAARSFLRWCRNERLTDDDLADTIRLPKVKVKEQRTITAAEVGRMLLVCDPATDLGQRNAAIIALLYDSGLRSAELCRLRLVDLDLNNHTLHVRIKGGADMPGWFGQRATDYLADWLAARWARPGVDTVFVGIGGLTPGQRLTPRGLGQIIRSVGERARIAGASPHAFRRGFAVALSAAGLPDNILKDLGRWQDVSMIRRYTLAQRVGGLYRSPLDHNPITRA